MSNQTSAAKSGSNIIKFIVLNLIGFFMFFVGDEAFAAGTIPALVLGRVDMVFEFFPDKLDTTGVVGAGCADKIGWFDTKLFDEFLEFGGIFSDVLFDGNAEALSFAPNFVAMFVSASLETDGVSLFLLIASIDVCQKII